MVPERVIVTKFGGTSVGGTEAIHQSCNVIAEHYRDGNGVFVVASALNGVTDQLIGKDGVYNAALRGNPLFFVVDDIAERHRGVIKEVAGSASSSAAEEAVEIESGRVKDMLMAISILGEDTSRAKDTVAPSGEMMSPSIVAACLTNMGIPVAVVDARQVMKTNDRFGNASLDKELTAQIVKDTVLPELAEGKVVVMGGYHGTTKNGFVTTFGRGGSDMSATAMAKVFDMLGIHVSGVHLYKADRGVDGIMSADPKIVGNAHLVDHASRKVIMHLGALGGKVIHPRATGMLDGTDVVMYCRSTLTPQSEGTRIDTFVSPNDNDAQVVTKLSPLTTILVSGIGMDRPGIVSPIFERLVSLGISVRAIHQGIDEQDVFIHVDGSVEENAAKVRGSDWNLGQHIQAGNIEGIEVEESSALAVVGPRVDFPQVTQQIMGGLYRNGDGAVGKNVRHISSSGGLFTVVFRDTKGAIAEQAVRSVHQELFKE